MLGYPLFTIQALTPIRIIIKWLTCVLRQNPGGYQAQVDFGEFQISKPDGSVEKLFLFSMILGYSRKMYAELIERYDLPTFLDCHIRTFEYLGGVPEQILYDRMRNVYIGKIAQPLYG
jgi:transposase